MVIDSHARINLVYNRFINFMFRHRAMYSLFLSLILSREQSIDNLQGQHCHMFHVLGVQYITWSCDLPMQDLIITRFNMVAAMRKSAFTDLVPYSEEKGLNDVCE
ncbi:unnamed protein product [Triticum turgidum subsp. durum]|uniref:Uncharacterized protein n=1 Tax=Triticum turgidum subsp. durum TaxID=4567 RepID=A0A9R0T929_TRITD|nr:unnamed protein product [Triticum turgidum subsp. durum]